MSLLPMDPANPLYQMLNPGMPAGGAQGGLGGLFGRGPSWLGGGAEMGQQPQRPAGLRGLLSDPNLAFALLANSGPSMQPRSFGQIFGQSALQARQMQQDQEDAEFKRKYMEAQMAAMGGKDQSPSSVREYEYAKKNGYTGSFQDWIVAGGQSSRPSAVQEWEFYNQLIEDDKKNGTKKAQQYLEMKRNPNFQVKDVNQIPTVINPSIVGGTRTTPLSSLPQVTQSAEAVKQAEGRGSAVGGAQGAIVGGIQTKGANAQSVIGMLEEARKLIPDATGSLGGTAVDAAAGAFGKSTKGAQATARLQVLQAGLMLNMPRMEGPQSDRDVELYKQAAASLGDPKVPRKTKEAAVEQIMQIQQRYAERAQRPGSLPFKIYQPGSEEEVGAQTEHLKSLLDKYAPQ